MMFRIGWMFGFVSTREYSARARLERFGPEAGDATDAALRQLEQTLFKDRLAIIVFLIGVIIVTYTFLNCPR